MSQRSWIAATVIAAWLGFAGPAWAQTFNPTTFSLDNGMQVVVVENHRAPVVTHMLWYKAGAADEMSGKSGAAHFLEHLMFKGTEIRAPGDFSDIIARNGGRENAFTSYDYTGYFQTIAADRLGLMMELEADRMTNLVLTSELFEPERKVVLEERSQRIENDPGGLLSEQVNATMFTNHPYRLPLIGWAHEIEALQLDDVLDFYATWYAPNNAVLIVAGDVTAGEVRRLAEQHYGPIPARPVPARARLIEPPHIAPREVVLEDARAGSPSWSRRYLAPSYTAGETEHAYALQVLAELLGGGATSRLYSELVVEGESAASAGAFYDPGRLDLSTFGVWVSPRPGVEVDDAAAAVEAQIELLLTEGVAEDEVERAKQRMLDSVIFAQDSFSTVARIFGAALSSGQDVADVENWPARVRAVTVEQVEAAARAVLRREQSTTGILLPTTDKQEP